VWAGPQWLLRGGGRRQQPPLEGHQDSWPPVAVQNQERENESKSERERVRVRERERERERESEGRREGGET